MNEIIRQAELAVYWRESDRQLPLPPRVRVTDFTKWIYSFYDAGPRSAQLEAGKRVELAVDTHWIRRNLTVFVETGWRLRYRDPLDGSVAPLKISALTVGGQPLWGRPDIVFEHTESGSLVIVRKEGEPKNDAFRQLAQCSCTAVVLFEDR
jgi:hypothetical protein